MLNLSKKEINHKNIINRFVSYSEIPAYLNAADAAIIWRDKSIVNKVASPVKFSEYVCCGLPVIANNTVDMISEYLTEFDCGIIIDSLDSIAPVTLKNLSKKNRKMISGTGIVNFGIETVVESYFKIYSSIINL
ncbi:MAG TPA: glycosyltransferase [Ignavibacteriaceae bacterium]|nr:glycosyltransferase [Ignavibacteriaceae bacterium]